MLHEQMQAAFNAIERHLFFNENDPENAHRIGEELLKAYVSKSPMPLPEFFRGHWQAHIDNHQGRLPEDVLAQIQVPELFIENEGAQQVLPTRNFILGYYTPMNPAIPTSAAMTFCIHEMVVYIRHLIYRTVQTTVTPNSMNYIIIKKAIELVVKDVYHHQAFHYYSQMWRMVTGAPFDFMIEEKMAVAASYSLTANWIRTQYDTGKQPHRGNKAQTAFVMKDYFKSMSKLHFESYHIQGYNKSDMINPRDFSIDFDRYVNNQGKNDLRACECYFLSNGYFDLSYVNFKMQQIQLDINDGLPNASDLETDYFSDFYYEMMLD